MISGTQLRSIDMNNNLQFVDVYCALLEAVPELSLLIAAELGKYYDLTNEAPAEYPVFEDVVMPFLRDSLNAKTHGEAVRRLFAFLERMANSNDPTVVDLLRIGILESLAYDSGLYSTAQGYMGPKTAEYVEMDRQDYERRKVLPS